MSKQSAASRVQENLQELFKSNLAPGNAYIKFQLTSDIAALLSMKLVQESLIVEAEQITALPNMPESNIGMMNSRDRVFCIFDLAQLLSLPTKLIAPRQYQIIILQTQTEPQIHVGLAVAQLQGIMRLTTEQIQFSTDAVNSNITPYISGVYQQQETKIPILQFKLILKALQVDQTSTA